MYLFIFLIFCVCIIQGDPGSSTDTNQTSQIPDLSEGRPHPAIIEGYLASEGEFPYAMRVYIYAKNTLSVCTGQIVASKVVLTAAHCLKNKGAYLVVGGNVDHTDFTNNSPDKFFLYKVTKTYSHPQFNRIDMIHDVALLQTGRAMNHKGATQIPISYARLPGTVMVSIYGWGSTELDKKNQKLRAKRLKAKMCSLHNDKEHYEYVCLEKRGICHGDSGGGAIYEGNIVGVASFYHKIIGGDCKTGEGFFYASMAEEKTFIENHLKIINESSFIEGSSAITYLAVIVLLLIF